MAATPPVAGTRGLKPSTRAVPFSRNQGSHGRVLGVGHRVYVNTASVGSAFPTALIRRDYQRAPASRNDLERLLPPEGPGEGDAEGDVFFLPLENVVCGMCDCSTVAAWNVAHKLWPSIIVGQPGLFLSTMHQVWPAVQHLHDSVLLLRLLVEEGIVGARSTSGRLGPVVGTSPRTSGVRPLLPMEIVHSWGLVKDQCLAKWGILPEAEELRGPRPGMLNESTVREAFQTEMSRWSSDADAETSLCDGAVANTCVVAAMNTSPHMIFVTSEMPEEVTRLLLGHCGVTAHCHILKDNGNTAETIRGAKSGNQRDNVTTAHVLVGGYHKLRELTASCRAHGPLLAHSDGCEEGLIVAQREELHLVDWNGITPQMRAKAGTLALNVDVISDMDLAELMEVTESTLVMDGISWD